MALHELKPPVPSCVLGLDSHLVNQGAEGRIFSATFLGKPTIIKERFKKSYRHPILDEKITSKRVAQEIRTIAKCRKCGIDAPCVYFSDPKQGLVYMEKIDGITVREAFCKDSSPWTDATKEIAFNVGVALATLHNNSIIHGDLTTSNMMLRGNSSKITFIDFGLSTISTLVEDKAVDVYVLERALISTHIDSEDLFLSILEGYCKKAQKSKAISAKLDEVRLRGRKKLAFG